MVEGKTANTFVKFGEPGTSELRFTVTVDKLAKFIPECHLRSIPDGNLVHPGFAHPAEVNSTV